jgi:hypothetical protein
VSLDSSHSRANIRRTHEESQVSKEILDKFDELQESLKVLDKLKNSLDDINEKLAYVRHRKRN